MRKSGGFTALELIIVIVIVAVFAAITVTFFGSVLAKAARNADEHILHDINETLKRDGITDIYSALDTVFRSGFELIPKENGYVYAFDRTACRFEYVTASEAYNGNYDTFKEVFDGAGFKDAANKGGLIYLKNSIILTEEIRVDSDLTLFGKRAVIEGSLITSNGKLTAYETVFECKIEAEGDIKALGCTFSGVSLCKSSAAEFSRCEFLDRLTIEGENEAKLDGCRATLLKIEGSSPSADISINDCFIAKTDDNGKNTKILK